MRSLQVQDLELSIVMLGFCLFLNHVQDLEFSHVVCALTAGTGP